jgi:Mg/Co/Ni transporter MgtE
VLKYYAAFVEEHFVITLFLTMLVGAGGNAGNQSTVFVVRELALADPLR